MIIIHSYLFSLIKVCKQLFDNDFTIKDKINKHLKLKESINSY